ncbi:uncharacterized protein LOC116194422 [Punica granatum]|uniref:Uncharacterized protein LOC116194422 n=2 Tax=Punica granatum TaxID=22663 RepID=A0A6P8CDW4_PUNGR|nr:uncharacterized protein LOC116194422 [Punica granatum]PKI48003.1 hypothetical protein CRG98_031596 [Punica granatum]
MNSSNFVNGSSSSPPHDQEQPPSLIATNPVSIELIESSVAKLIRKWNRRKRWQLLFSSSTTGESPPQALNAAAPWRNTLVQFLESNPVHIVSILLLVSDVVLTTLELSSSFLSDCTAKRDRVEDLWYHRVGISILCVLLGKSLGLALALGASFFTRPGYIVDGSVLIGAIFMETFLEGKGGGLLVMVSLWRVLRLVESAFELSDDAIEAQIKEILLQLESLREDRRLTATS